MSDHGGLGLKSSQDERLSKKQLQTSGYVQELMGENKKLREILEEYDQQKLHCDDLHAQNEAAQQKIKMIQEQCLAKADEINASLVRKHIEEQTKLKEEKLTAEMKLETQTREMALEIERLQKLNASLEEALRAKAAIATNHSDLRERNELYKQQVTQLEAQIKSLTESNKNQLIEMKALEETIQQQKHLKQELSSSKQTIKELQSRIKQLESEVFESNNTLNDIQESEIKSYKTKLINALHEVSSLQHQLHTKDSEIEELKQRVAGLMNEVEEVQILRFSLEREIEKLQREIVELKKKMARLKGKTEESGTFKEFVAVKRELAILQEEYNKLTEKLSQNSTPQRTPSSKSKPRINLTLRS